MNYKEFFTNRKSKTEIPSKRYEKERKVMLEQTRNLTQRLLNEKKLRIFDFDDTLVQTKSKIYVERPGGVEFELTPAEFAVYEPEGDEKFDYSDFGKLIEPQQIKKYNKLFKTIINASGNRKVTILTARGSQKPINDYLDLMGIDKKKVNIVALSNRDPNAKKRYVKYMIEHGYDDILFLDDSIKNVKAVQSLEKEFPNVKIDARQARL